MSKELTPENWKHGDPEPEGYKVQQNKDGTKFRLVPMGD